MSDWRANPAWPDVDVVMPILNEAAHLPEALHAVRMQEYPGTVRVYMAIGPSNDGTESVAAELAGDDDGLTLVDNPTGRTPSALNLAIRAGSAPVVVRVDGHSQLNPGYIARAVETLRRTGAANVGGMQVPVPTTPFEESVTAATTSWLGTGGATYRTGGLEAAVDTVYLGVFDRSAIEAVGLFDERLIRNQDYELNIRLRAAGGSVVFDPELAVGYTPRGSWRTFAKQYFEYGRWKAVVLRIHPDSLRLRQVAPLVLTIGVLGALLGAVRWRRLTVVPIGYGTLLFSATRRSSRASAARVASMLAIMHLSWGIGFITSPFRTKRTR